MFYTYLWLREDGTPYYVGKGKEIRGYRSIGHRVHCPDTPDRIIVQDWSSEEEAYEAEKFFIEYYGRLDQHTGCLANLTDGGEGHANPSEETRKKLRDLHIGNQITKGRKHTEEAKQKISLAHQVPHPWAAKLTPEQIIEIRQLQFDCGQRELGRRFGVDHKVIGKIIKRKTWSYVE
jgi:hypothetical protein